METYTLTSRDLDTGMETVASFVRHCAAFRIAVVSIHFEASLWTVVTDKAFPDEEFSHFEREDTQTTFTRGVR